MWRAPLVVSFSLLLFAACGGDDGSPSSPADAGGGGLGGDGGDDIGGPCRRNAPAGPGAHKVVVGHPYDENGAHAGGYEVLDVEADGDLVTTGVFFEMRRVSSSGHIRFTPDGAIGMVAQDDGTLGVFRFTAGGVEVVHDAFSGPFYARDVHIADDGTSALVIDPNWRNNGGGIYRVAIACDGTLTSEGLVVASKLGQHLRVVPGTTDAVLAARDIGTSPTDKDVHLISLADVDAIDASKSADAFDDDGAVHSDLEVTGDGRFALVSDIAEFSPGAGNRVAVVALDADPDRVQLIDIEDPYDLIMSPHGNAVALVSGYGNAIFVAGYDPDDSEPLSPPIEITYAGAAPQLPARGAVIGAGDLVGLALLTETKGIRRVRFEPSGAITDLGLVQLGEDEDLTAVPSAIGITP